MADLNKRWMRESKLGFVSMAQQAVMTKKGLLSDLAAISLKVLEYPDSRELRMFNDMDDDAWEKLWEVKIPKWVQNDKFHALLAVCEINLVCKYQLYHLKA